MSITDTVSSIAHDVQSLAQDAAHAASDLGKQAVEIGRSNLQSVGSHLPVTVQKKRSRLWPTVTTLGLVAAIAAVSWAVMRKSSAPSVEPEVQRIADKNHVRVA